jgi:hypothetical protein
MYICIVWNDNKNKQNKANSYDLLSVKNTHKKYYFVFAPWILR